MYNNSMPVVSIYLRDFNATLEGNFLVEETKNSKQLGVSQ